MSFFRSKKERVFNNPVLNLWIKYFEKPSKTPKLPSDDNELRILYQQVIWPTTTHDEIFCQQNIKNQDDYDFLVELFGLRMPIYNVNTRIISFVLQNDSILMKQSGLMKILAPIIIRTLIQFSVLMNDVIKSNESQESVFGESLINIINLSILMMNYSNADIKIILTDIFQNIHTTIKENDQSPFRNSSFRYFMRGIIKQSLVISKMAKKERKFVNIVFSVIIEYISFLYINMDKYKLNRDDITNLNELLKTIADKQIHLPSLIEENLILQFCNSILCFYSLLNLIALTNIESDIFFLVAYYSMQILYFFFLEFPSVIEMLSESKMSFHLLDFVLWTMKLFQGVTMFSINSFIQLPDFIDETSPRLLIDGFENENEYQHQLLTLDNSCIEIKSNDYIFLVPQVKMALDLFVGFLRESSKCEFLFKIFQHVFTNQFEESYRLDSNFLKINEKDVFFAAFALAYGINMIEINSHTVEKIQWQVFMNPIVFDKFFEPSQELFGLRSYVRKEIYGSLLKLGKQWDYLTQTILGQIPDFMLSSKLYVCDEILVFLNFVLNNSMELFYRCLSSNNIIPPIIKYGKTLFRIDSAIELQKRYLCFLKSIITISKTGGNLFFGNQFFLDFCFQSMLKRAEYLFFCQLFSVALHFVDFDCFCAFFPSLHRHLQSIIPLSDSIGFEVIVSSLLNQIFPIIQKYKSNIVGFIQSCQFINDLIELVQIFNEKKSFKELIICLQTIKMITENQSNLRIILSENNNWFYNQTITIPSSYYAYGTFINILNEMVFEIDFNDYNEYLTIKNPEAIILFLKNVPPPYTNEFLSYLESIISQGVTNLSVLARSSVPEFLFYFYKENCLIDHPSIPCIERILSKLIEYDFQMRYLDCVLTPNSDSVWFQRFISILSKIISRKTFGSYKPCVCLNGDFTYINIPKIEDTKQCSIVFCFIIEIKSSQNKSIFFRVKSDNDRIELYIEKSELFIRFRDNDNQKVNIKSKFEIDKQPFQWHVCVINISISSISVIIDGSPIHDTPLVPQFRINREINGSIGSSIIKNGKYRSLPMSVGTICVFKALLNRDNSIFLSKLLVNCFSLDSLKAKLQGNSSENTPFESLCYFASSHKSDKNLLISQVGPPYMYFLVNGIIISDLENWGRALIDSNGILKFFLMANKNDRILVSLVSLYSAIIQANQDFEKEIIKSLSFKIFWVIISRSVQNLFKEDLMCALHNLFYSLTLNESKYSFLQDFLFNPNFWLSICSESLSMLVKIIIFPILKDYKAIIHSIVPFSIFSSYILLETNPEKRQMIWKLLFFVLSLNLTDINENYFLRFLVSVELSLFFDSIIILLNNKESYIGVLIDQFSQNFVKRILMYLHSSVSIYPHYLNYFFGNNQTNWRLLMNKFIEDPEHSLIFEVLSILSVNSRNDELLYFFEKINQLFSDGFSNVHQRIIKSHSFELCISQLAISIFSRTEPELFNVFKIFLSNILVISWTNSCSLSIIIWIFAGVSNVSLNDMHYFLHDTLLLTIQIADIKAEIISYFLEFIFEYLFLGINIKKKRKFVNNESSSKLRCLLEYGIKDVLPLCFNTSVNSEGLWIDIDLVKSLVLILESTQQFDKNFVLCFGVSFELSITMILYHLILYDPTSSPKIVSFYQTLFPVQCVDHGCFSLFASGLFKLVFLHNEYVPILYEFASYYSSIINYSICEVQMENIMSDEGLYNYFLVECGEIDTFCFHYVFDSLNEYSNKSLNDFYESYSLYISKMEIVENNLYIHDILKLRNLQYSHESLLLSKISKIEKFCENKGLLKSIWFDNSFHPMMIFLNSSNIVEIIDDDPIKNYYYVLEHGILIEDEFYMIVSVIENGKKMRVLLSINTITISIGGYQHPWSGFYMFTLIDYYVELFLYNKRIIGIFGNQKLEEYLLKHHSQYLLTLDKIIRMWNDNTIGVFDFLLKINFCCGKSFNKTDNYPIMPNLMCGHTNLKRDLAESYNVNPHNALYISERILLEPSEKYELSPDNFSLHSEQLSFNNDFGSQSMYMYYNRISLESIEIANSIHHWVGNHFGICIPEKTHIDSIRESNLRIVSIEFCCQGSFNQPIVYSSIVGPVLFCLLKDLSFCSVLLNDISPFSTVKKISIPLPQTPTTNSVYYDAEQQQIIFSSPGIQGLKLITVGSSNHIQTLIPTFLHISKIFKFNEQIIIITRSPSIVLIDINTYNFDSHYLYFKGKIIIAADHDETTSLLAFLYDDYEILLINEEFKIINRFYISNISNVNQFLLLPSGNIIISCIKDNQTTLYRYTINGLKDSYSETNELYKHFQKISFPNGYCFIAMSHNLDNFVIMNPMTFERIHTIKVQSPITSIMYDSIEQYLIVILDNQQILVSSLK